MRITLMSVFVDDQAKALDFYTRVLGFEKKHDVPLGEFAWLTVVSPDAPDGVELVLEPDQHPAARTFKDALVADGIPFTAFDGRRRRRRARPAERPGRHVHPAPGIDGSGHHGGLRRHLRQPAADPLAHPGVTPLTRPALGH